MVVLPIFWDQHDNAQRVHETGLGVRLPTYSFDDHELAGAIDRLLADRELATRLGSVSGRLRSDPGTVRAADLIEEIAAGGAQPEAFGNG
jgi:UDP:flavonoid glycosyltransferase YjiC (YdhE family)